MDWIRNRFKNWPAKIDLINTYFRDNDLPIEKWEREKVEAYVLEAMRYVLNHAYNNNEFYKNKISAHGLDPAAITSFEDIQKVEFTEKDELRGNPYKILCTAKKNISQVHLSTGTTGGEPIYMMHTWDDLFVNDLAPEMPVLFPLGNEDVVINALPYEMSSAGLSYHRVVQDGMTGLVVPVGKGGYYSDPVKTLQIMKDLQANILITTPSYANYLYDIACAEGIDLKSDINIQVMWITGEGCSNSYRNKLENKWGCKSYFYYGSLECGPIGIECPEKNGYHITNGHVYLEIIDPDTGKRLEPGEIGEIVVTTLLREGMPLIRYKTQDLGYIEDIPCDCGIHLKRLFLRGRLNDQINIHGTEYSPYYVEDNLMKIEGIGDSYRFLVYDDYLLVETEIDKDYTLESGIEDFEEIVSSRLEYACGVPNKVKVVDKIPYSGGKMVRVINKQST